MDARGAVICAKKGDINSVEHTETRIQLYCSAKRRHHQCAECGSSSILNANGTLWWKPSAVHTANDLRCPVDGNHCEANAKIYRKWCSARHEAMDRAIFEPVRCHIYANCTFANEVTNAFTNGSCCLPAAILQTEMRIVARITIALIARPKTWFSALRHFNTSSVANNQIVHGQGSDFWALKSRPKKTAK